MDFDTIRPFISGLVGALVVWALMARMQAAEPIRADDTLVLRHPRGLGYFGLVMCVVFGAFAVRNAIYGSEVNSYAVALLVPLVLALGSLYLAAEVFLSRVVLSGEIVVVSSPFGTREMAWTAIVRIEYAPGIGMYMLHTPAGARLRVSPMLAGVNALLDHAHSRGIPVPE